MQRCAVRYLDTTYSGDKQLECIQLRMSKGLWCMHFSASEHGSSTIHHDLCSELWLNHLSSLIAGLGAPRPKHQSVDIVEGPAGVLPLYKCRDQLDCVAPDLSVCTVERFKSLLAAKRTTLL